MKVIYYIVIVALVFIFSTCTKSNNTSSTVTNPSPTFTGLFGNLASTPQSLSVQAGRDTVIFGASGTWLHFYVNSFADANNVTITCGTIMLQLLEIYSLGDMIRNGINNASGRLSFDEWR